MSIAGFIIVGGDLAIAWADTAFHDRTGTLVGHRPKLVMNPIALCLSVGVGWSDLIAETHRTVLQVTNVDRLPQKLPPRLRRKAEAVVSRFETAPVASFAGCAAAAVGYSLRAQRVLGQVYRASGLFVPVFATAWCSPELNDIAAFAPSGPADMPPLLQRQYATLDIGAPAPGAGVVTIATVRANGASLLASYDLHADAFLQVPPRLPAMHRRSALLAQPATPQTELSRAVASVFAAATVVTPVMGA